MKRTRKYISKNNDIRFYFRAKMKRKEGREVIRDGSVFAFVPNGVLTGMSLRRIFIRLYYAEPW